tara:strand:+ start:20263 stop:20397 length:135 start_codon:yes stop_codon:yes gene_type:complete
MFTKKVKTHNIRGAVYKTVIDWDAVWGAVFLSVIGIGILSWVFG